MNTAKKSSTRSVSLREAAALIKAFAERTVLSDKPLNNHHNIYISGPPGVAKSSITATVAKELGMDLIDLRLCTMEASQVDGIPYLDTVNGMRVMNYSTPVWWPTGERPTIIVMDELPNATPAVQTAALRLLQERTIQNGKKLPDNVMFVALGNRREDKTGARPLLATVSNRFSMQLEIDPMNAAVRNDWVDWAWDNNVSEIVLAFLDFKKEFVYQVAQTGEGPFPSFRSWTSVSDHLEVLGDETFVINGQNRARPLSSMLRATISGAVGQSAAAEFMGFRDHWESLPDWSAVRGGDFSYEIERGNHGIQYAIAASAASHLVELMNGDLTGKAHNQISNICHYIDQLNQDMLIILWRSMQRIDKGIAGRLVHTEMKDTKIFNLLGNQLVERVKQHRARNM